MSIADEQLPPGASVATPLLRALGDGAWSVVFGSTISPATHARVLAFAELLGRHAPDLPGVEEWVPSFCALTVHVDPRHSALLAAPLLALARAAGSSHVSGRRWRLPACFDGADFAPDLPVLAAHCGLTTDEVLRRLCAAPLRVYMLGFLPGFAYLGDLPAELHMPRLASPRVRVPAGSVAVAAGLCAAYPAECPGGWRLIGRTPLRLFDAGNESAPALLASGDEVRWQAVDRSAWAELAESQRLGRLAPADLRDDPR